MNVIIEIMYVFLVVHYRLYMAQIKRFFNFVVHIVTHNVRDKSLNEDAHCLHADFGAALKLPTFMQDQTY